EGSRGRRQGQTAGPRRDVKFLLTASCHLPPLPLPAAPCSYCLTVAVGVHLPKIISSQQFVLGEPIWVLTENFFPWRWRSWPARFCLFPVPPETLTTLLPLQPLL